MDEFKAFSAEELRFTPPLFPEEKLLGFLRENYGIIGELKKLAGERDQNFRVTSEDGTNYVYKVASPDELESSIDFQIQALKYLEKKDPDLSVPRQLSNKAGAEFSILKDKHGKPHNVRLLSYVEGAPIGSHEKLSLNAVKEVGRIAGRLCAALDGFSHPAATHFMPWDILNGIIFTDDLIDNYLEDGLKKIAREHLLRLKSESMPKLLALPARVIHNDAHSGNVMSAADNPEKITGIIDFGDMVYRPIIVDVAVSLCSMLELNDDAMEASASYLAGYEECTPIPDAQIELLYDALAARYIMSVQLLKYRICHHSDDDVDLRDIEYPCTLKMAKKFLRLDRAEFTDFLLGRH